MLENKENFVDQSLLEMKAYLHVRITMVIFKCFLLILFC